LKEGDVIGIALDFNDLPMLTFFRGGKLLVGGVGEGEGQGVKDLSVRRVRGSVHPAVGVMGGAVVQMLFNAPELYNQPPGRCQALVVSQDML
ncbi:unnamed protein product, partial [Choristocarpus tenellus]